MFGGGALMTLPEPKVGTFRKHIFHIQNTQISLLQLPRPIRTQRVGGWIRLEKIKVRPKKITCPPTESPRRYSCRLAP